jgi:23S rRNA-/tRNA-specific pseudouridylate synthase
VAFALSQRDILYQDDALLAVAKPAGVPTVPTADTSRTSLVRAVQAWLTARGERNYLSVHQRLDRETSGVVLFARASRANAGLAAAFARRQVEKTYVALTARPAQRPEDRFRAASPIEGRPAVTDVAVVRRLRGGLLVEARPRTGRKHQVGIHLARAGLQFLVYDRLGCELGARALRLMLHARFLELDHPISSERLRLECSLPEDFRAALAALS